MQKKKKKEKDKCDNFIYSHFDFERDSKIKNGTVRETHYDDLSSGSDGRAQN